MCYQYSERFTKRIVMLQMVRFYGAMFREGDVWICMEVMDTSLDKFYKKCNALSRKLPEPFIAKVTLSVGALVHAEPISFTPLIDLISGS